MIGLTRTAALEYAKRGIRVNAVSPGLIDTQIARDVVSGNEQAYAEMAKNVPVGRAGRPEEIASVVLWLCSPGASYVVGHGLTVDGGLTVAKKLSTEGAPSGSDPDVGDIAYQAPWGNIAIFYRDFDFSTRLVKLGKLDGDVDALRNTETTKAAIELIKE